MVTHMSKMDQQHMLQLFQSFTKMDGQGVATAILHFSGELQQTLMRSCCHMALLYIPFAHDHVVSTALLYVS